MNDYETKEQLINENVNKVMYAIVHAFGLICFITIAVTLATVVFPLLF